MLMIILSAVLPALAMLYFIYTKDKYQREPGRMIWKGFLYGVGSALLSLLISFPYHNLLPSAEGVLSFKESLQLATLGAGAPEEAAKLILLMLFLRKNPYFNEWMDGIVYAVCIGMGFAAFENISYVFGNIESWLSVSVLRGLVSIPGHFFFAVTMGYFFSRACFGNQDKRTLNFILAWLVPMLLHSAFDTLLMASSQGGIIATGCGALFIGLFLYMYIVSKKRIAAHLKEDEATMTWTMGDQLPPDQQ